MLLFPLDSLAPPLDADAALSLPKMSENEPSALTDCTLALEETAGETALI